MKPLSNETKGTLYCILSGLLYIPLGYFGISIMNANVTISNMLFWRYSIAAIVTLAIILPQLKSLPNINYKHLLMPLLVGGFCYGGLSYVYFLGSKYIGTGLSIVIFFIYPAIIIVVNKVFYNHKVGILYYISISVIMLGLCFLIDQDAAKFDLFGIFLALSCAIGYAIYILMSKSQISNLPPLISTLMVSVGSAIAAFIITLFEGGFVVPDTVEVWQNILGLAIICTALPILFLLEGLKYIQSEKASILSVLEPVGVFLIGVTVLDEHVNLMQIIGVIIILLGAMLVQIDKTGNEQTIT